MKDNKYKVFIAYLIMLTGVMLFIAQPLLLKKCVIARLLISSVVTIFGGYYMYVLLARLEKYGKC